MRFLYHLIRHKIYILISGFRVGKIPLWNLLVHDLSKLTPQEFYGYNRQYYGDKGDRLAFYYAWLAHQNRNQHHWEYYIMRTDKFGGENIVLPMPEIYIREMVADWLAASKTLTGDWDISAWLDKNYEKILLHPETKDKLREILNDLNIPNKF